MQTTPRPYGTTAPPPADAPPLERFRWRLRLYSPALAARWEAVAARLPSNEVRELHHLLGQVHDEMRGMGAAEEATAARQIVAHLADLPALWHLLDAHVHSGCLVPQPEDCPVCQRVGREPR